MDVKYSKIGSVFLANYIIAKLGPLCDLKLQKILYYIEAWHLAMFKESLITDDFQAWVDGPVCYPVWQYFRAESVLDVNLSLTQIKKKCIVKCVKDSLEKDQVKLIHDVLSDYGKRTPFYLECLTREELPWKKARMGIDINQPSTKIISKDTIKQFYFEKYEQKLQNKKVIFFPGNLNLIKILKSRFLN